MAWLHGNTWQRYAATSDKDAVVAALIGDYQVIDNPASADWAFNPTGGRDGDQSLHLEDGGCFGKGVAPGSATSIVGLPCRMNTTLVQAGLVGIWDGIGNRQQVVYVINADGSISAYRMGGFQGYLQFSSGTLLGSTAPGLFTFGSDIHLGFVTTIHASAGVVKVYINGVLRLDLSGLNTQNASASGAVYSLIVVGNYPLGSIDLSSGFYICDDTGAQCNAFLGDLVGEVVRPTANGVLAQWTASSGTNAACVDDVSPDGDATRVTADSVGLSDLYTHGPLTQIADGIQCAQIVTIGKKSTSGTRALAHLVRSGGTTYAQTDQYLGSDYAAQITPVELDPATSAPWTVSGWNATQIGQKVSV
jgi:hypothetical protein